MNQFLQSLVDGASNGAIYGLAALGIALVFGVMRLANFAYGELITASAYALVLTWPVNPVLAVALSLAVPVALALAMEAAIFRQLRTANPATLLIASFGLSFLLQRIYEAVFGNNVRTAAVADQLARAVEVGRVRLQMLSVVSIIAALVLLGALWLFLRRTSLGRQVQAASADFLTARMLGVRANSVIALTFGLSGVLAAAVAFVLTVRTGAVNPSFGVPVTVLALIGAVIGGIDRLGGALVGGFIVGFAISQFSTWLPQDLVNFRDTLVFGLVILILLVKPGGLFADRATLERA